MSITTVLQNKETSAETKLASVAETIGALRESYGNSKAKIEDVKVSTTHGSLPFSNLEPDSKVEILLNEALNIKVSAIAAVEDNPAIVLNKKVEELLATNSLFANASAASAFDVL
jgi:hypothetical protein